MLPNVSDSFNWTDQYKCKDGLILSCWQSDGSLHTTIYHALVYVLVLVYMFVGVAIIADRFMAAIEVITSQERDVTVRRPNGEKETISVRVWNQTVSNLTLMALGSSAPEILLSIIEIYANNFEAGELGPGTIVGSAAFNMFIIIALCVVAVPSDQVKRIKYLRVFVFTLTISILAYVWMLVILVWNTPGVIQVWEGLLTFSFFFLTILWAYIADKRLLIYKYLDKRYRFKKYAGKWKNANHHNSNQTIHSTQDGTEVEKIKLTNQKSVKTDNPTEKYLASKMDHNHRDKVVGIVKSITNQHPSLPPDHIESMARTEMTKSTPKSHAHYRLLAAKCYFGSNGDICSSELDFIDEDGEDELEYVNIQFDPAEYSVVENAGQIKLTITRTGDISSAVMVSYETQDGTANSGLDYIETRGLVEFGPEETHKQISIDIIDDDVFEEDEQFEVKLFDAKYRFMGILGSDQPRSIIRLTNDVAVVTILDDDHCGIFAFENCAFHIEESIGELKLVVNRYKGARGDVTITYRTVPGTAKANKDFEMSSGTLHFANNETQKSISLQIMNGLNYEKNVFFHVELGEPARTNRSRQIDPAGEPQCGQIKQCTVQISQSEDFRKIVDNLLKRKSQINSNRDYILDEYAWESQIAKSLQVQRLSTLSELSNLNQPAKEAIEEDIESQGQVESRKSPFEYTLHCITLVWRILFAMVPPPSVWNGWACFIVSIVIIGILTAFINDLASHFGSTVHLKDSITAISFVALGTSLPDTFASMIAARNEKTADSSIGNVTGSNSVNVFLGIGLAWSAAALYHAAKGTANGFTVNPGSISYSVALFCACAVVCAVVLMTRRTLIGGELGGPLKYKVITVAILIALWLFYLCMSTLEAYGVVRSF